MFISCWSVKGGSGTTVVAASLALVAAESSRSGALLVDLAGDLPAVLGLADTDGDGIGEWLMAGEGVPADALARLESPAGGGVDLIRRGNVAVDRAHVDRAEVLAGLLAVEPRPVVVDCGLIHERAVPADGVARTLAASATHSWLVTRACYLSLRRAVVAPITPSGVVLVRESGRSLRARDIEDILQVPVVAQVAYEASVARAVDAGLLAGRLPRVLEQAVRARGMTGPVVADALYRDLVAHDPEAWSRLPPARERDQILALAHDRAPLLASHELVDLVERIQARVAGLGPLEPLLLDDSVTEVMVNGDGACWVERRGRIEDTGLVIDEDAVLRVIERIVAPLGRRVDRSSPLVDARLPDGSRVNAIVRPVAVDGPCLTIRRFGSRPLELDAFTVPGVASLLQWAVRHRTNILVSGGTGSGKTTLLNALAGAIPAGERIITIEDTAELRLRSNHVVRLESRVANAEGTGELSVRELVRNVLRMRPDRIVVGEVRGDEVIDMLTAMNTGHEGSLSTVHANSPGDAIGRLESMILMAAHSVPLSVVRRLVAASIDLVVQVDRSPSGARAITAIGELDADVGGDGVRVRSLTTAGRLSALPQRPPRVPTETAPDREWLTP